MQGNHAAPPQMTLERVSAGDSRVVILQAAGRIARRW
jgi:hypothetical protein